ncbi:MAG: ATP-binding cassette domain-containing protein [bacterium]|nr:ATP-binding cassette domain-containing protein [bacterium]
MAFLKCGPLSARGTSGSWLFRDVVVKLSPGRLCVLEGASGSGKSTLLRQLVGLEANLGISRSLANEYFDEPARMACWRARVTLLPQEAPVLPGTVAQNLRFPFEQRQGCSHSFDSGRARELLDQVGLREIDLDREIGKLSGGERHRLALVRGLLWDPPVLVADEPLAGLDSESARVCFELLASRVRRPGHAGLVVLHHRELGQQADERWLLDQGRLEMP